MTEEKRKFTRHKCLLPAEVLKAEGKDKIVKRTTIHDFSQGKEILRKGGKYESHI